MRHKRLFIPGPTEVRAENLAALARPQVGHRSEEFRRLYRGVVDKLRRLLETEGHVFLFTSSSSGVWEAAVRNCVGRRLLSAVQGAFSQRWFEVAQANGKPAEALSVEWGRAIRPEMVDQALATGKYDALGIVHNETSTGVINPLESIARVAQRYPDVLLLVDAVSSMGGVRIPVDDWGIDVCLAGLQKAFALPPGLAVASVSERALERASAVPHRGHYFDFLRMRDYDARDMTPSTPAIPQIQALDAQLDDIFEEGPQRRFSRHAELAGIVQRWAQRHFTLFAEEGFASPTLTCVRNTRDVPVATVNEALGRQGAVIANGYGKLKQRTFRIAHMGDTLEWEIRGLLAALEEIVARIERRDSGAQE